MFVGDVEGPVHGPEIHAAVEEMQGLGVEAAGAAVVPRPDPHAVSVPWNLAQGFVGTDEEGGGPSQGGR